MSVLFCNSKSVHEPVAFASMAPQQFRELTVRDVRALSEFTRKTLKNTRLS